MLSMLRDLVEHKGHANAALLEAIRQHTAASADGELWALLHHVLLANRFWLLAIVVQPFDHAHEAREAPTFAALVERFAALQAQEAAWLASASPADLDRTLRSPLIPGGACSVAQAWMQVCLHSHGHRAQAAKLLRRLGGTPPATDFILWLPTRPVAAWPPAAAPEAAS
jgi:uncharacterized damage-inducible protein DinB